MEVVTQLFDDQGTNLEIDFLNLLETGVSADGNDELKPLDFGQKAAVKSLFASESRAYCNCCKLWDDEKPNDDGDAHIADQNDKSRKRFAIMKRLERHGRGVWKTHSVVINSQLIRQRLVLLFDKFPDVDPHAAELQFKPPFLPFVHRWEQLLKLQSEESDETAREHLGLLIDLLYPECKEAFMRLKDIERTGFVAFNELSLIYIIGEVIVSSSEVGPTAGILRDVNLTEYNNTKYWTFTIDVVDWSGQTFGIRSTREVQYEYKGSRAFSDLNVLPFRHHANPVALREQLVSRGRTFENLRGHHFRSYVGKANVKEQNPYSHLVGETTSTVPIFERVIIDTQTYYSLQHLPTMKLRPLEDLTKMTEQTSCEIQSSSHQTLDRLSNEENGHVLLTDDECFFATPWVRGFALQSKKWCQLGISQIQDIKWNDNALQNLVLDNNEKRLLTAVVASQKATEPEEEFDDFIDGKVAEDLKKPLYRLGAADLGSTVTSVETHLVETLARCAAWNAVLLIDEADVFLEARTTNSLTRNELISIFLRLLEYYTGVLILTTNRPTTIDPAFESRIDISLRYPELDLAGRKQVLRNLLATLPKDSAGISEGEISSLMEQSLNGRQIKSAVKTARITARSEGSRLKASHLQVVLELREKASHTWTRFDYPESINGSADRAD